MERTDPAVGGTLPSPGEPTALRGESLALGLRVLADLLAAGLPMTRALVAFGELAPPVWQRATPLLLAAVKEGRGFASALEDGPLAVPSITVGIIRAGEAGGGIVDAVRRAADHAEALEASRAAVRAALAYPAVVALAGGGAIVLMIGVVLPRFASMLADLDQALPATTRVVLVAAEAARSAFVPLLIFAALVAFALRRAFADPGGRRRIHAALLAVPLLGPLRHSMITARFCAALGPLLESGLPLRTAMMHAAAAVDDGEIELRIRNAREDISAGSQVGRALLGRAAVTQLAARLVSAGEETGELAGMVNYAGRLERSRTERITRSAVRLIEPLLILVFAGIVALVAAALLQAVYAVKPA